MQYGGAKATNIRDNPITTGKHVIHQCQESSDQPCEQE